MAATKAWNGHNVKSIVLQDSVIISSIKLICFIMKIYGKSLEQFHQSNKLTYLTIVKKSHQASYLLHAST